MFDDEDPNDDAEEQYCDVDSVIGGMMTQDEEPGNTEPSVKPKAEVELPVESKPPLDFDAEPNAAFHLQTESRDEQRPTDDPISRDDSMSDESSGPSTPTIDRDHHRRPPLPPTFTIDPTKSDQQDEETTRLFHGMWHDYHDHIAPRFIEWVSHSIPPTGYVDWVRGDRQISAETWEPSDLPIVKALLGQISEAQVKTRD